MVVVGEMDIIDALRGVTDPARGADIVSLGMVQGLRIKDGRVVFALEADPKHGPSLEPIRAAAERAALTVKGVTTATAILTAEKAPVNDPHGMGKNPALDLPVRKIIAVASGKGGVGKSTIAFNLAISLARQGCKTGLLDADIYGPSLPILTGTRNGKPENRNGKLTPLEKHGLKLMSIGFMTGAETPLIWRGPMVQTALYQMLRDVEWGSESDPLDILVVDMPPGTGDAQLTMAQKVKLDGAVIVSTPQDLALADARKAIAMFAKTNVPVLGIVENMSVYICPSCGHEDHIFGHGGARTEAEKSGVPFLGAIDLDISIRCESDAGQAVTHSRAVFDAIADRIREGLNL